MCKTNGENVMLETFIDDLKARLDTNLNEIYNEIRTNAAQIKIENGEFYYTAADIKKQLENEYESFLNDLLELTKDDFAAICMDEINKTSDQVLP